jgi:DNA helicase IV
MPHPELADEQSYLDHAYRCLEAMRDHTTRLADISDSAAQAVDSEAAQMHLQNRLRSLDADVDGLCFGRLDEDDGAAGPWYVGRRHVEDARGDPVVVEWRADVAVPFYRATAADPLGLRRRRRFLMAGRSIDDLFDEVFDDPESVDAAHHGGIPDPLLAELERSRTGEMRDIVATIAAEQDLVIRAPLDTCLVVQGGPGTGKTAVGLHRAAFLLYEHRGRLDREGVLVVGPNPLFLRYIAQVLPSLGETAVRQTTLERLLAGTAFRVRGSDSRDLARLKGDPRMARILAQVVRASRRPVDEPLQVATSWGRVQVEADAVAAAVKEVASRGVAHNVGRTALRTRLLRLVRQVLAERRGEEVASGAELERELAANRGWQKALDRLWPPLSAPALVRKLLSSRAVLRRAASGILDADEVGRLVRPAVRRLDDEPWTVADLVLLDEARWMVAGAPPSYGHVMVDEAQDLSAMAFRALARRCPTRSMTVLGDLAQATGSAGQHSWEDVAEHLGPPSAGDAGVERVDLDLGYRVPAPIMDLANRLLVVAAPDVAPCRSIRPDGRPPVVVRVPEVGSRLAEVRAQTDRLVADWGSVGVVVPPSLGRDLGDLPATVVRPSQVKGLEFDAVVVVEPSEIAEDEDAARGLRLLYVALTRAVQELVVVHSDPLPAALTETSSTRFRREIAR